MPRVRPLSGAATLIRPLLAVTRAEVLAYLASVGQTYRDDSSNASVSYTRNRLRLELLPLLERDFNPQVREALLRLSQIAGAANDWMEQEADAALAPLARPMDGGVEIDVSALCSLPQFLAQLVLMALWRQQGWPLQDMSHEKWTQLFAFAVAEDPSRAQQVFPGNVRVERQGRVVRLVCETR
jgi:tRNA(Ile)-lysidine synthase